MQRNRVENPGNVRWKEIHLDSKRFLARVQSMLGKREQARSSAMEAMQIGAELTALDPKNILWSHSFAQSHWTLAQLSDKYDTEAQSHIDKALSNFSKAHAQDPTIEDIALWLAKSRNLQAEFALMQGDTVAAQEHTQAALAVLAPFWKLDRKENHRLAMAEAYWLKGQAARADGNLTEADEHWQVALALLSQGGLKAPPFLRLELLVRTLNSLGRKAEAGVHIERLQQSGFVPLPPYP